MITKETYIMFTYKLSAVNKVTRKREVIAIDLNQQDAQLLKLEATTCGSEYLVATVHITPVKAA